MLTCTITMLFMGFINNFCSTEIEPLVYKGCQETMQQCVFQNISKTINEEQIPELVEHFYACQDLVL